MNETAQTPEGRVVELFPKAEAVDHEIPIVTRERIAPRACWHERHELDEEARRVYCRDCKVEIPAFDVLAQIAKDAERLRDHRKRATAMADAAQKRLDELERREHNAKARLLRLRKKAPINDLIGIVAELEINVDDGPDNERVARSYWNRAIATVEREVRDWLAGR